MLTCVNVDEKRPARGVAQQNKSGFETPRLRSKGSRTFLLPHPYTAEAVTPVTLTAYTRTSFERLMSSTPAVRVQLVSLLSKTLLATQQQLFVLGCQTAKQRLASFLLRLADRTDVRAGERLDLAMGRLDIADHLGMTIETVCRAIAALRDARVITVPNSHQLILNDLRALRALSATQ